MEDSRVCLPEVATAEEKGVGFILFSVLGFDNSGGGPKFGQAIPSVSLSRIRYIDMLLQECYWNMFWSLPKCTLYLRYPRWTDSAGALEELPSTYATPLALNFTGKTSDME